MSNGTGARQCATYAGGFAAAGGVIGPLASLEGFGRLAPAGAAGAGAVVGIVVGLALYNLSEWLDVYICLTTAAAIACSGWTAWRLLTGGPYQLAWTAYRGMVVTAICFALVADLILPMVGLNQRQRQPTR